MSKHTARKGEHQSVETTGDAIDQQAAAPAADAADAQTDTVQTDTPTPLRPARLGDGFEEIFLDERNDVLTVINELEDQLDTYQQQREGLERDLTMRSNDLNAANQRIQELEWQAVTFQTRIEALEQSRQESGVLEDELTEAQDQINRVAEQLDASRKESQRLTGEIKAANKQLEELWTVRKERDGYKADAKDLGIKLDALQRDHQDAIDAQIVANDRIRDAEITIDELRKLKATAEMNHRAAEDRVQELTRVHAQFEEKIETLRSDKKALQAQIAHLERDNTRLAEQRQFFETEISSMRNQNRSAENALASVKKAFTEVRVALAETKTRVRRRSFVSRPRSLSSAEAGLGADDLLQTQAADTDTVIAGADADVATLGDPTPQGAE